MHITHTPHAPIPPFPHHKHPTPPHPSTQHALEINTNTIKLPKLQYKGDAITPQRIRKQRALVVEETSAEYGARPCVPLRLTPAVAAGATAVGTTRAGVGAAAAATSTGTTAVGTKAAAANGVLHEKPKPSAAPSTPQWELTFPGDRPVRIMQLDVRLPAGHVGGHVGGGSNMGTQKPSPTNPLSVHVQGFACVLKTQDNTTLLCVPLPLQVASATATLQEGVLSVAMRPKLVSALL